MASPRLRDWPTMEFIERILAKHPAPRDPETGDPLWQAGIRLHGTQAAILAEPYRFKQVRGGIRAGKSFIGALAIYLDFLWMCAVRKRQDLLWWVVGPDYEQAQPEMKHLARLFTEAGIAHTLTTPNKESWQFSFPHMPDVKVVTKTASAEEKLAGVPPRGIVMGEAAQDTLEAWEQCFMRVSETRGWVMMEGTFEKAAPWYYQLAEEWSQPGQIGVSYPLPSWANPILYPEGREDPGILIYEHSLPPAVFLERFGGEPTKPSNLKLPEASLKFHVAHRFPALKESFDPEMPVFLAIDPGSAHAYAVLAIQCWGNVVWVIDAIYRWGKDAKAMVTEASLRPWAKNVEVAVMDIAGEQQSSTGESNANQWRDLWPQRTGNGLYLVTNRVPLELGYELHQRALLNSWPEAEAQRLWNLDGSYMRITDPTGPRLMFSPDAAPPLFGGRVDTRQYRGEYQLHRNPRRPDGTIPRDKPVDEDNDAIKALNYFLFYYFTSGGRMRWLGPVGNRSTAIPWEITVAS